MTIIWRLRVLSLVSSVLVIATILVIAELRPQLVLVSILVVVVAAAIWLALDLGAAVEPAAWRRWHRPVTDVAGADSRTHWMRARLARTTSDEQALFRLHSSLVGLIDDRLLTEHLIDRNRDPDAAHAILGAELIDFVNRSPSSTRLSEPRELAHIVTLIENV